jgi:hypothetical protein
MFMCMVNADYLEPDKRFSQRGCGDEARLSLLRSHIHAIKTDVEQQSVSFLHSHGRVLMRPDRVAAHEPPKRWSPQ